MVDRERIATLFATLRGLLVTAGDAMLVVFEVKQVVIVISYLI